MEGTNRPPGAMIGGKGSGCGCGGAGCGRGVGRGVYFGKKILCTLIGIALVYLIFYLGTLMRLNMREYYFVGMAPQNERTITVVGYGKQTGKNDIAVTTIGYTNTDKDVAKAQADNKAVMDKVLGDLKKMGIADKDLESNYSIYPQYTFVNNSNQFTGYQVNNSVTVKVRDLSKISDVLALAGKYGANSVGGLTFTVDDTQALKDEARATAVADARAKAIRLAQSLGVVLSDVVAYNEFEGPQTNPYPMANNLAMATAAESQAAPAIASGSQDVEINVNVTYKILPAGY